MNIIIKKVLIGLLTVLLALPIFLSQSFAINTTWTALWHRTYDESNEPANFFVGCAMR